MAGRSLFGKKRQKAAVLDTPAAPLSNIPQHVAIIMDGNNRWAKQKFLPGIRGHRAGVEVIRKVLTVCEQQGVKVLTLFAFSSENWLRPEAEVTELMKLLDKYIEKEAGELHQKGIRLCFVGRRDRLEPGIVDKMLAAEQLTKNNNVSTLVLAIDYGGQWDIAQAAQKLAEQVSQNCLKAEAIDEALLASHLSLNQFSTPDLCIRTGGEHRISNFLLWQFAYAELYFTDCYWPDFNEEKMNEALQEYAQRQRRFGKTSEQMQTEEQ